MKLSQQQKTQIKQQLLAHRHKDYCIDLILTEGKKIENFKVKGGMLRPELMTSLYLAQWIFFNNGLYFGKRVADIGCGCGIQGIVTALHGARMTLLSDISDLAIQNTQENIEKLDLKKHIKIIKSDLFAEIKKQKFDLIIFNHPFFSDLPFDEFLTSKTMLGGGELIHRFFKEAKKYLTVNGLIVMPYFHLAGRTNDPAIQAPQHGYSVSERFKFNANRGLQKGPISIYEIKKLPRKNENHNCW